MNRVKQAIAQWQREMPELDLLPMEVVGYLKTTQLLAQERLQAFFKEYGLQLGEFDVLATLRRSGAPYRLGPTQLFETLMVSSGGMTSRLDRLEKAGLIVRSPNPEDRRGTLVSLTEEGLALMNRVVPRHVENEARMLSALSREEQQALGELLSKLLEGLVDET
ncbi:MarR family transcriptional regulator [Halomonas sp. MCCC 1A17488]|uniref:MarR family transcriptional regulator n=1 Tax=Billgrantia sulfidoxydans TaxID=2733484 RepID=A0ABX7W4M3_9GAMM|nr:MULTISPECIES: MarR family transcriptional regulator [Halomonas]MCE8016476.1 MarR family transcriptional regulator [Halomonas sp. MCCC 1A17488]MCG3239809.1 MarR family transcriptional regulator [Halomonas sp. MCCC 1A17488]QPP50290.1 MarR family transcriptional regulator [Halomonas sp. SS10-MC5]QTP53909.1 MarR family transcriptional regulator [Halomonas sulfidoxydans]